MRQEKLDAVTNAVAPCECTLKRFGFELKVKKLVKSWIGKRLVVVDQISLSCGTGLCTTNEEFIISENGQQISHMEEEVVRL